MGFTYSPPASEGPHGSDSAPHEQDQNPRTAVYGDEARHLLETPARIWDPRDFGDYETAEHWWTALAVYGGILLTVGIIEVFAPNPVLMAILGIALSIFVALPVLIVLGMEVGVGVFAAGCTILIASFAGLWYLDATGWFWARLLLPVAGELCLALGVPQAWYYRGLEADDERGSAQPAT